MSGSKCKIPILLLDSSTGDDVETSHKASAVPRRSPLSFADTNFKLPTNLNAAHLQLNLKSQFVAINPI